jgi:hypothetical protein
VAWLAGAAIRVEQERQHHRRIIRWAPVAIGTIGTEERRDIHLFNGRQDEPSEMILRQPLVKFVEDTSETLEL